MKYERLKQLMAQDSLSVREMREKDQLVNELLPLMMDVVNDVLVCGSLTPNSLPSVHALEGI